MSILLIVIWFIIDYAPIIGFLKTIISGKIEVVRTINQRTEYIFKSSE